MACWWSLLFQEYLETQNERGGWKIWFDGDNWNSLSCKSQWDLIGNKLTSKYFFIAFSTVVKICLLTSISLEEIS